MLLTVKPALIVVPTVTFTFVVPGAQSWRLRSVRALATRAVGGTPNRAYTLQITDGTNPVAVVGAADAGTEPGTCTVTWANAPASSIASGASGISTAPLGPLGMNPGYVITGTIVSPAAGDTWTSAVAWYEFVYTGPQS